MSCSSPLFSQLLNGCIFDRENRGTWSRVTRGVRRDAGSKAGAKRGWVQRI